jgi:hypothetical protein
MKVDTAALRILADWNTLMRKGYNGVIPGAA